MMSLKHLLSIASCAPANPQAAEARAFHSHQGYFGGGTTIGQNSSGHFAGYSVI